MTARLGLLLPLTSDPYGPAEQATVDTVVRAGLVQDLWVRDLPLTPAHDRDTGQGGDPFAHLAWLLGRDSRPGPGAGDLPGVVGTASVILGLRHPLLIARAVAGLHHHARTRCGGSRFVLGVGSGGKPAMNQALGVAGRSLEQFAAQWASLRAALRDPTGGCDGLEFLAPPGYRPPPVHLATSDLGRWEAIGGDADGWQTFVTDESEFLRVLDRVCEIRGGPTPTEVRLDATVVSTRQAPTRVVPERGRVTVDVEQLVELTGRWRRLPIAGLILSLRADDPIDVLRRLHDATGPHRATDVTGGDTVATGSSAAFGTPAPPSSDRGSS